MVMGECSAYSSLQADSTVTQNELSHVAGAVWIAL